MEELKTIEEINKKYGTTYCSGSYDKEILLMFNENIIPETTSGPLLCCIAMYYGAINNERLKLRYLLKSVESHISNYACSYLSTYYENLKNYEEMEKYLLLGITIKDDYCLKKLKSYYMKNKMYMKIFENCNINNKAEFLIENYICTEEVLNILTKEELKIYLINFEMIKNGLSGPSVPFGSFGSFSSYNTDFFQKNENIIDAYFEIFETTPFFKHDLYKKLNKFEKVYEIFTCPILLTEQPKGYKIKTCKHIFSFEIFKCNKCPCCRVVI